jgi:TIR domain
MSMSVGHCGRSPVDILVERFDRYFRHPDLSHDVLRRGDRAIACDNVRRALPLLVDVRIPAGGDDREVFDEGLEAAVEEFQRTYRHRVSDGAVGPGTRKLIVSNLLGRFDASIFRRLCRPEIAETPSVFLSYAWRDSEKVDKLDQWLRDHGVKVLRDQSTFEAGASIPENIRRAVAEADKVVGILSANSRDRDWPRFETTIAEELERRLRMPVLIYVCLDETPLLAHDRTRVAIHAEGKPLKDVGDEILHALTGSRLRRPQVPYDEDAPL